MSLLRSLPAPLVWRSKVLVQFALACLPGGEAINHRLQRLREARGASSLRELVALRQAGIDRLAAFMNLKGAVAVEVGTGWNALPTMMLCKAGAGQIYTYDHVDHLRHDLVLAAADAVGLTVARDSLESTLASAGVRYSAPGDAAHTGLPDASVGLFYSYAVLEHVPPAAVTALVAEARRVLKPGGIWYSMIGLHDHYLPFGCPSAVNFLRYPDWAWNLFVQNSISYHNRMRERDFVEILRAAGASLLNIENIVDPADIERCRTMHLAKRFGGYTPEELAVTRTEIIARFS